MFVLFFSEERCKAERSLRVGGVHGVDGEDAHGDNGEEGGDTCWHQDYYLGVAYCS